MAGTGISQETGWRFSIYESVDGWCTQLETETLRGAGCGGELVPADGEVLMGIAAGSGAGEAHHWSGIAPGRVAQVWLHAEGGRRHQATLMDLAATGADAWAFVVFAPPDIRAQSLVALDAHGEILDSFDVGEMVRP